MEQNQHQQRRAADQRFRKSSDQVESTLDENLPDHQEAQPEEPIEIELVDDLVDIDLDIDLAAFEDAVADIEQYLEENTK